MKHNLISKSLGIFLISLSTAASAYYGRESTIEPDLLFEKASVYRPDVNIRNQVFFPSVSSGTKVPAVVLMHSCSGIHSRSEETMRMWTQHLNNNGYAVLVIDHLGPRGKNRNCGRQRTVADGRLVKDLYDGVGFLSNMSNIDQNRIFTLGFSLGAMTSSLAASKEVYEDVAKTRLRPRAVAGLYGGCDYGRGGKYLYRDSNLPILWLMGGNDSEAPANSCLSDLESIEKKVPETKWHVYPKATHCWDCKELHNYSKTAGNGTSVTYLYDEQVTEDSKKRVVDYFNSFK